MKFDGNIEDFCDDLVDNTGMLLMPGTFFEFDDKRFRIGFGKKNMPESLGVFEECIEKSFIYRF